MLDFSDGSVQLSENDSRIIAAALHAKSRCDGKLELMNCFPFAVFGKPGKTSKD